MVAKTCSMMSLLVMLFLGQGSATICTDLPPNPDFSLDQWLETPIRYEISVAAAQTVDCVALKYEAAKSRKGQQLLITFSLRNGEGETMIDEATAVQVDGKPNHFETEFQGTPFYLVILNTDYTGSSAFLYCTEGEVQGVLMATRNDLYGSEAYEERLEDFKEFFQPDEFKIIVHDDNCSYDFQEGKVNFQVNP